MLNMSAFDNVLKEFYENGIRETLNQSVTLFRVLDQSDKEWSGKRVVWPVHVGRNSGVGARLDGGTLPTAGAQSHQLSIITSTYQYGRISVTGPTIASGKYAFAEAMAVEMDGITKDLTVDLSRQCFGTGDGRLAQVGVSSSAASGSITIAVKNRFTTGEAQVGQPGARYISSGQLLTIGTVASPNVTSTAGLTVSSVSLSQNPATTTDLITLDSGETAITFSSSNHFLFNFGAGGQGVELKGLQALVDDFTQSNFWGSNAFFGSSIQGIARETITQWNASVLANSGVARVIDGNLMQTAFDQLHVASGMEPDMIIGEHQVVRAFLDHVSADRRYMTKDFEAGRGGLSYNGIPIERDRHAPFNTLFVMVRRAIKQYTLLDTEFASTDGSILSRVSGVDEWEAFIRCYKQIGIDTSPKETLVIRDIRTDF